MSSSTKFISFLRANLKPTAKAWFYFVSTNLRPSKHVSKVLRNKTILTYAILNGYKFKVGDVIECSILESENSKALPHPSLITKPYLIEGVEMLESKEKCPIMATLPLLKEK